MAGLAVVTANDVRLRFSEGRIYSFGVWSQWPPMNSSMFTLIVSVWEICKVFSVDPADIDPDYSISSSGRNR